MSRRRYNSSALYEHEKVNLLFNILFSAWRTFSHRICKQIAFSLPLFIRIFRNGMMYKPSLWRAELRSCWPRQESQLQRGIFDRTGTSTFISDALHCLGLNHFFAAQIRCLTASHLCLRKSRKQIHWSSHELRLLEATRRSTMFVEGAANARRMYLI